MIRDIFREKSLRFIYCCGLLVTINGCLYTDISDLDTYVQEVLVRPGGKIDPIPEIKPYEAYVYKSSQGRNPFKLFFQKNQEDADDESTGLTEAMAREIQNRNKEHLEQFELDSLSMVGIIENKGGRWGIVKDPEQEIHKVKIGNYLGRNTGKILDVSETSISIREIVKNSSGRWEERQVKIVLVETE